MEQEIVCFSQGGEESKRGGMLDEDGQTGCSLLYAGEMPECWLYGADGSKSCPLDLKCCCDSPSSLKQTILPKSVSLAECMLYRLCEAR